MPRRRAPLSNEQLRRFLQPTHSLDFCCGLLAVRELALDRQPEIPETASPEFAAGLQYGHTLIAEHQDLQAVLLQIDDLLLRAYLERIGG